MSTAHTHTNSEAEKPPEASTRSSTTADAILSLFAILSTEDQERIFKQIKTIVRPIQAPRAGEVLGAIVRLLPRRKSWAMPDIKGGIAREGVQASPKEIYNAIGYLTRKGRIKRVGYGRYIIDGAMLETLEDIGIEPGRSDDD
jgi:hypothetical protein